MMHRSETARTAPARRARFIVAVIAALSVAVALSVGGGGQRASAAGTAQITGKITDILGSPISAIAVLYKDGATDDASTKVEMTQADENGNYALTGLSTGTYKVGFTTNASGWDANFALQPSFIYVSQWYDQSYLWSTATTLDITSAGETLGGVSVSLQNPAFADVSDPSYSLYPDIQWMAAQGISTGTAQPSGKPLYLPSNAVSREALASFLYKFSGASFVPPGTPTFADVGSGSPFYTSIEWMAAQGISTGTVQPSGKPLFKPADPVSRQSAATFLARYKHVDLSTPPSSQSFADVPVTATTASAIAWMKQEAISIGTAQPSGLPDYFPASPVSRSAIAAFLHRLTFIG